MEPAERTESATEAPTEVLGGVKRSAQDAFDAADECASLSLSLLVSPSQMAASCLRPPSSRLTSGWRRCCTEMGLPSRPA